MDTEHKLIVAHEVTNAPVDRNLLFPVARLAQDALQTDQLTALADRGYYKGEAIRACYQSGIRALVPKTLTSGNRAAGLFDKQEFVYDAQTNQYRCPAGEAMPWRHRSTENGLELDFYYASAMICRECRLKSQCTKGRERRVRRWEHEDVLDAMAEELHNTPDAMAIRAKTVEHPFGTLKAWMGATHFSMKRLKNVRTEMSLHVLAYNLRRMISIMGVGPLMEAMRA